MSAYTRQNVYICMHLTVFTRNLRKFSVMVAFPGLNLMLIMLIQILKSTSTWTGECVSLQHKCIMQAGNVDTICNL